MLFFDLDDYEALTKVEWADIPNIENLQSTIVLNQMEVNFSSPLASN